MTQQEILDYNRLCAEFLNFKITDTGFPNYFFKKIYRIENLKFHEDWNWIMEVVEAIEKENGVSMVGGPVKPAACVIHLGNLNAISGQGKTKKEATVKAIYEFLKQNTK